MKNKMLFSIITFLLGSESLHAIDIDNNSVDAKATQGFFILRGGGGNIVWPLPNTQWNESSTNGVGYIQSNFAEVNANRASTFQWRFTPSSSGLYTISTNLPASNSENASSVDYTLYRHGTLQIEEDPIIARYNDIDQTQAGANGTQITIGHAYLLQNETYDIVMRGENGNLENIVADQLTVALSSSSEFASCRKIQNEASGSPSGNYTIDPDGAAGPIAPFVAYCDMDFDGGGWTLMAAIKDEGRSVRSLTTHTITPDDGTQAWGDNISNKGIEEDAYQALIAASTAAAVPNTGVRFSWQDVNAFEFEVLAQHDDLDEGNCYSLDDPGGLYGDSDSISGNTVVWAHGVPSGGICDIDGVDYNSVILQRDVAGQSNDDHVAACSYLEDEIPRSSYFFYYQNSQWSELQQIGDTACWGGLNHPIDENQHLYIYVK